MAILKGSFLWKWWYIQNKYRQKWGSESCKYSRLLWSLWSIKKLRNIPIVEVLHLAEKRILFLKETKRSVFVYAIMIQHRKLTGEKRNDSRNKNSTSREGEEEKYNTWLENSTSKRKGDCSLWCERRQRLNRDTNSCYYRLVWRWESYPLPKFSLKKKVRS